VLKQRATSGDQQGAVRGRQPTQRDRVAGRGCRDLLPVAGASVQAGPVDVNGDVAGAVAAEQPHGVPLARVSAQRGPATRDVAEGGGGRVVQGALLKVECADRPPGLMRS
jgi:hypothetical protein